MKATGVIWAYTYIYLEWIKSSVIFGNIATVCLVGIENERPDNNGRVVR